MVPSRLKIAENYYRQVLYSLPLCPDVIEIILSFILDLYIHELKRKYLHFFETHTLIFQTYVTDHIKESSFVYICKNMLDQVFTARAQLVAVPLTYTKLACTLRAQKYMWMKICWHIIKTQPGIIFISNWKLQADDYYVSGLPLVYFFSDIIRIKFEECMERMGLATYKLP
jgi:hypothetical protein